jgi:hypothetical protein
MRRELFRFLQADVSDEKGDIMAPAQKEAVETDVKTSEHRNKVVMTAIQKAKAKNARLRLMKERNENYLAERRDEDEADEELTKELRVSAAD